MKTRINRRNFLTAPFSSIKKNCQAQTQNKDSYDESDLTILQFANEFSPNLLAMEAERLGLDPVADRKQLLLHLSSALEGEKTAHN